MTVTGDAASIDLAKRNGRNRVVTIEIGGDAPASSMRPRAVGVI